MTQAARRNPASHLSPEASSEIIRALEAYQAAYALTDYDVAEIAGVSRDTIGRWKRQRVELRAGTIERIFASIEEYADAASAAHTDLKRLLSKARETLAATGSTPTERLRRHLNSKGHRGNAVVAEINAIGLQVTVKAQA